MEGFIYERRMTFNRQRTLSFKYHFERKSQWIEERVQEELGDSTIHTVTIWTLQNGTSEIRKFKFLCSLRLPNLLETS